MDFLLSLGSSSAEPVLELFHRRRKDEYRDSIDIELPVERKAAFYRDIEKNILALGHHLLKRSGGCSVVVVDIGIVFYDLIVLDHLLELFFGPEVILDSVFLLPSRCPGRNGNGMTYASGISLLKEFFNSCEDGALTYT